MAILYIQGGSGHEGKTQDFFVVKRKYEKSGRSQAARSGIGDYNRYWSTKGGRYVQKKSSYFSQRNRAVLDLRDFLIPRASTL
jgi:hypothetical protein